MEMGFSFGSKRGGGRVVGGGRGGRGGRLKFCGFKVYVVSVYDYVYG